MHGHMSWSIWWVLKHGHLSWYMSMYQCTWACVICHASYNTKLKSEKMMYGHIAWCINIKQYQWPYTMNNDRISYSVSDYHGEWWAVMVYEHVSGAINIFQQPCSTLKTRRTHHLVGWAGRAYHGRVHRAWRRLPFPLNKTTHGPSMRACGLLSFSINSLLLYYIYCFHCFY